MTLTIPHKSTGDNDDLVIDCGTCVMRRTNTCTDCMVTFLLENDADRTDDEWSTAFARNRSGHSVPAPGNHHSLVFDLAEQRAVRTLTTAGLLPELRYRAGS